MTFPAALRSILRQAPNIIMIGEIRDLETASIATNASLTGHLVFSTLHTNDAPSAVARLVDLGVQPFLVASSVRAIMAQRLVRRLCANCKQPGRTQRNRIARITNRARAVVRGASHEAGRMRPMPSNRLQGSNRHLRDFCDRRRRAPHDQQTQLDFVVAPTSARARHAHTPGGRRPQGACRPHLCRRSNLHHVGDVS